MVQESSSSKKSLGEMLVESGLITPEQLTKAQDLQKIQHKKLIDIIIENGMAGTEDAAAVYSIYLNIPYIDLKRHPVQSNVINMISEQMARKHTLIPLDVIGNTLMVIMSDPENIQVIEDLAMQSKMRIQPALGTAGEIQKAIEINYKLSSEVLEKSGIKQAEDAARPVKIDEAEASVKDTPTVKALHMIIAQAVRNRASDIHIEPEENRLRIRYRVDGILYDRLSLSMEMHQSLISRIKILAGMNITEHRKPQDGQLELNIESKAIDIRVATAETAYGEMAVLRLLDKSLPLFTLAELGMLPESLNKYRSLLNSPFGMILISGPTGSGKTTTLYASVNQLDRKEKNIITIEDPIEYHFVDINQIQVNSQAGITFSSGLRAVMRLDPNIILVGEIRDSDTARTAVQAALTGHLLLSSIHANDTIGVIFRLIDLGVDRFLIPSTLIGVVAQRMVRRICPHCRTAYQPSLEERLMFGKEAMEDKMTFYHGAGCNFCLDTGYLGRTGVFEVLVITDTMRDLIGRGVGIIEIKAQAIKEGMVTLRQDGFLKIREGFTTLQEVARNVSSII